MHDNVTDYKIFITDQFDNNHKKQTNSKSNEENLKHDSIGHTSYP